VSVLLLAEISDKMPTVAGTTVVTCLITAVSLGLGLIRRWLVLLSLPVIAFYDSALCKELLEPGFGQLIITELGWRYVIGCFAGWNLPFLIAFGIVSLRPHRCRRPGHCTHCGYSLHGLPESRCPECGTPFSRRGAHDATRSA